MADVLRKASMGMRLIASSNMVLREEGGEGAILFDVATGKIQLLNVTAAEVYKLFDGNRLVGDIMRALRQKYDDFGSVGEAQVLAIIGRWLQCGVLRLASETSEQCK